MAGCPFLNCAEDKGSRDGLEGREDSGRFFSFLEGREMGQEGQNKERFLRKRGEEGMKDYYSVLGLTREAGEKEIKAAYRKLAKQYHPDVVKGDKKKEARMYEIQEAYGCLGDSKQREQYDRRLEEQEKGERGRMKERRPGERKQRGTPGEKAGPMPDMDAFERFFGFQAGKGMETYHPKGEKGKKPEGAVDAGELFASFFGKIGR